MKNKLSLMIISAALICFSCDREKVEPEPINININVNESNYAVHNHSFNGVTVYDTVRINNNNDITLTFGIVSSSVQSVDIFDYQENESQTIDLPYLYSTEYNGVTVSDTIKYGISWISNSIHYQLAFQKDGNKLNAHIHYSDKHS